MSRAKPWVFLSSEYKWNTIFPSWFSQILKKCLKKTQIHLINFKNCLSFTFSQALPYIRNPRVGICFPDFSIHFAFGDQICKLFSIARIRVSLTILCLLKILEIIHTVCVLSSTPWILSASLIQKFHLSLIKKVKYFIDKFSNYFGIWKTFSNFNSISVVLPEIVVRIAQTFSSYNATKGC